MHKTIVLLLASIICFSAFLPAEDWPNFRGPHFDGSAAASALSGDGALSVSWQQPIGYGYSGVVITGKHAVTMFSDGKSDVVAAYDANSGKELWRHNVASTYKGHDGSHDGPIATPAIANNRVFGLTPYGHLFSVDLQTGKELWKVQLADSLSAVKPYYGFSSSPFVTGNSLVIELGGKKAGTVATFDVSTGKLKWSAGGDDVSYQSPILISVNNKTQILAIGNKTLIAVEPDSGKILWEHEYATEADAPAAEALVPVPAGENRLLLRNKMDGSTLIRINENDGKYSIENLWNTPVFKMTYSVPVYHNQYFYGYNGNILTCVGAEKGEMKWRSREPGDGFLLLAGDRLVIQTKKGSLHIAEATPAGYKEISKLDLFDSVSWTPPSLASNAIYNRSHGQLARVVWSSTKQEQTAAHSLPDSRFTDFVKGAEKVSDKKAYVENYLKSIRSYPLIEWPDHVHFIYYGPADDMAIAGEMIGERREDPMNRIPDTDFFWYSVRLDPDARLNYRFIKNYDQPTVDPQNNRTLKDRRGTDWSWFAMPGWKEPDHFKEPASAAAKGSIESKTYTSAATKGASAKYDVYLPPDFQKNGKEYPAIFIFGGPDIRTQGLITNTLDNLIGKSVQPVLLVIFTEVKPAEKPADLPEDDVKQSSSFIGGELIPAILKEYPIAKERTQRAIAGTGFGGFTAFYVAFSYPDLFGNLSGQSVFMLLTYEKLLEKQIRSFGDNPLRIYHDWGLYDLRATREAWNMTETNRRLNALLRERGYMPAGGETHEGFGWMSWRNRTDRWLATLFPMK